MDSARLRNAGSTIARSRFLFCKQWTPQFRSSWHSPSFLKEETKSCHCLSVFVPETSETSSVIRRNVREIFNGFRCVQLACVVRLPKTLVKLKTTQIQYIIDSGILDFSLRKRLKVAIV